ncbi:MAG: hypothetical protein KJ645_07695, partial [Planctomycetes bacterium]|nr:hypothetical protein [Planctomycetota bacterium]
MVKRERPVGKKNKQAHSEKKPGASTEKTRKSPRRASPGPGDSSVIYKTGEMPKMRGGGVAMRLAIAISATIFVIMVVMAIVMIIVVSDAMDAQIDAD